MVRAKKKTAKKKKPQNFRKGRYESVEYVACGADVSYLSLSVAGIAKLKSGKVRTAAVQVRWEKDTDYFERLKTAAKTKYIMYDLFAALKIMPELNDVYLAIEEPVSYGHIQRGVSGVMKQQIQISGAFFGGLLSWGWNQLFEIQANSWRKLVADELAEHGGTEFEGLTIHYTKWNPDKKIGKFRAKQWVEILHPKWDGHWPDLITHTKRGLIPRPEESKAQGKQSDDRYEAFAMAEWMRREIKRGAET